MGYTKTIVCLAKSRKYSGKCVAGLEIVDGKIGEWIRPVSTPQGGQVHLHDRRYDNGQDVEVLDIVRIRLKEHYPDGCQTENHLYDDGYHWEFIDRMASANLEDHARAEGSLWVNGHSSYHGANDRMPVEIANQEAHSLVLVRPTDLRIRVFKALQKRQVRGTFALSGTLHDLVVTDPVVESRYLKEPDGEYPYQKQAVLCVSVGEPFEGYQYKLIASVIDLDE